MTMSVKNSEEIRKMRNSGKLAASVLEMIGDHIKPGVTTGQLERICRKYILEDLKAIPSTLGHFGFTGCICTSVNHVICHGIPSEKHSLKEGDIVNIDVTVSKDGFIADTSKMYLVGKVAPHAKKLVSVTQDCLYKAIEIIKPGVKFGDIGETIHRSLSGFGL